MATRDPKKPRPKQLLSDHDPHHALEIKQLIKYCNEFIKAYLTVSEASLSKYATHVKNFFIEQSTNPEFNCLVGSLLSKISNILQPFVRVRETSRSVKNEDLEYDLKRSLGEEQDTNEKLRKKLLRMKEELDSYRERSTKLTNFIYMLRKNNIDVDSLYEKGCDNWEESSASKPLKRERRKLE